MPDSAPSLQARVERLEATLDIYRLEARYSRTWDLGLADEWAAVFTDDGTFERQEVVGLPGLKLTGTDELRGFCEKLNATSNYLHMMHSHEVEIEIDADEARAMIFFECRKGSVGDNPSRGRTSGYYNVRYVRTAHGWRMQQRVERHVFREEGFFYGLE